MLDRNLLDEAAQVLAMPIPRRKALKYVAVGFVGAALSFLWPKRAMAIDSDPPCRACRPSCINNCIGKRVDDPCTYWQAGHPKVGHCVKQSACGGGACCHCVPGGPPPVPDIGAIPDVAITREASLAAGNCREGTEWVASWFPGRHSVSARQAAAEAIARGKPRLARYIALTAHQVSRSAQG